MTEIVGDFINITTAMSLEIPEQLSLCLDYYVNNKICKVSDIVRQKRSLFVPFSAHHEIRNIANIYENPEPWKHQNERNSVISRKGTKWKWWDIRNQQFSNWFQIINEINWKQFISRRDAKFRSCQGCVYLNQEKNLIKPYLCHNSPLSVSGHPPKNSAEN